MLLIVMSLLIDSSNHFYNAVRNRCHPNPCAHGSKCTQTKEGFECACPAGFKGKRCTGKLKRFLKSVLRIVT